VSRAYGAANPTFTYANTSGVLNGDTFTLVYSTAATPASPVGSYPITAVVSSSASNYTSVTVLPGTLTITPLATPLVITVNNAARAYAAPNPTFTSAHHRSGPGDTFTVTYATTATVLSDVGSYPITATVTGANIGNYATVTIVPGTLAITPLAHRHHGDKPPPPPSPRAPASPSPPPSPTGPAFPSRAANRQLL